MEAEEKANKSTDSVQMIAIINHAEAESTSDIHDSSVHEVSESDQHEDQLADQDGEQEGVQVEIMESEKNELQVAETDGDGADHASEDEGRTNPEPQSLMIDEGPTSPGPIGASSPVGGQEAETMVEENGNAQAVSEVALSQPAHDSTPVNHGSGDQSRNLPENEKEITSAEDDDDDVVVVESLIRTSSYGHRPNQVAMIDEGVAVPDNIELPLPELMKTVGTKPGDGSSARSTASGLPASTSSAATPAAAVLKALAGGQIAVSTAGTGIMLALPRLASQNPVVNVSKPTAPVADSITSTPPIGTTVTVSTTQQNGGRQILPKPVGIVNGSVMAPGSNSQLQQRPQVNQQPPLSNNTSPNNSFLTSYLKPVLHPASVLPYRSNMLAKELGFLTPEGGYSCEECGDSFALKSCLEFHLQRRSLIIECNCVVCRQPLVFFNKCVYYGHVRQHSGNQRQVGKMVMRNVNIKPITWQLMEMTFEDTAFKRMSNISDFWKYETGRPMLSIDTEDQEDGQYGPMGVSGKDSNNIATAAASNLAAKLYNAANGSLSEHQTTSRTRCSECRQECANNLLLRQHFMYNLPPNQKQLICSSCQAVYFSQCSFKAHLRTHSGEAPFTCPECGLVEATHNSLNSHVMTHQKNPTVMDAWRCQKCLTFYSSWDALMVHIGAAHCDSYYRCDKCPVAFESAPTFEQHLRTKHFEVGQLGVSDSQLLVKCCQCEVVYPNRERLLDHLKTHFQKMMPFVVYRCALCGRLMENKGGLLGHFRNVHRLNVTAPDVCPVKIKVNATTPSPAKKATSSTVENEKRRLAATPSTVACPICPDHFDTATGLTAHLKRSHGDATDTEASNAKKPRTDATDTTTVAPSASKVELDCRFCTRRFTNKDILISDGRQHLRDGINVCLLCQNNDCGSMTLLSHHLQRHIEMQRSRSSRQDGRFKCEGHCEKSFLSAAAALNHLRQAHFLPPLRCFECGFDFSTEAALRQHRLQHAQRSSSTSQESASVSPAEVTHAAASVGRVSDERSASADLVDEAPSAASKQSIEDFEILPGQHRCNKCGVWNPDIESMHAHAVSHKEPKYFLCLECGVSFAATASLGRHLIVAHKISNVEKYLQDYPDANPDKPSELECSVCHKEFPSKTSLASHVRTHGLWFLKTNARPNV